MVTIYFHRVKEEGILHCALFLRHCDQDSKMFFFVGTKVILTNNERLRFKGLLLLTRRMSRSQSSAVVVGIKYGHLNAT